MVPGAASKVSDTVCDSMYRAGLMVPGLGELHQRLVTRFVIRCIGQGSWFPDLGELHQRLVTRFVIRCIG